MYTYEQNLAIKTRNTDLLVAAAAGSGKTAVLTERVISIISDEKNLTNISELLIVTFTEAAAAEMRARIRSSLTKAIDTSSAHLKSQILQLNNASITTFHSFCLSVIRKYFYLTDIDPFFKVADAAEAEILKRDIMDGLLEDMYTNDTELNRRVLGENGNALFIDLLEIYSGAITDQMLGDSVIRLHDFARGEAHPEAWLKNAAVDDSEMFETSGWYAFFMSEVINILTNALAASKTNLEMAGSFLLHEKYVDTIRKDYENINNCVNTVNNGWDALFHALNFEFATLSSAKVKCLSDGDNESATSLKEKIRTNRDNFIKKPIKKLRDKFYIKDNAETISDLRKANRCVKGLCGLAMELSRRFISAKREGNLLDFSDLEHECIATLTADGGVAASELADKYKHIIIDEYQDTNSVQELILSYVTEKKQNSNTFMVGDVKQSIYRFRLANPEIFNDKYESYEKLEDEIYSDKHLITLSKNFRSRKIVLDAVNALCSQILTKTFGGTDYNADEQLYFGATVYGGDNEDRDEHRTEIILISQSENGDSIDESDPLNDFTDSISKTETEAAVAAERVKTLLDEGFMVTEKDGTARPAEPRDIALLLRSPKSSADVFVRAMQKNGVSVISDNSYGYFDAPEVLVAISFLRIIDNPRQDIPLASVLHSRYAEIMLSASDLLEVRRFNEGQLYDVIMAYSQNGINGVIKNKLAIFLDKLHNLRRISVMEGISAVTTAVVQMIKVEHNSPKYRTVMENLNALPELAENFENTRMRGLFHFMKFIDKVIESKKDYNMGANNDIGNAVRIMSIHKSKGLEFPIVLLCGLGRKFNMRDSYNKVLFHNGLGVGTIATDLGMRVYSDTPKRLAISEKLREDAVSEELRVLYVAMTRAREKLIMLGYAKKTIEEFIGIVENCEDHKIPYNMLKANTSFMDFIMQAAVRSGYNNDAFVLSVANGVRDNRNETILTDIKSVEDISISEQIIKTVKIPRKLSVTEVKRLFYSSETSESEKLPEFYNNLRLPVSSAFASATGEFNAAQHGTLMHLVLERLPKNAQTNEDISKLLEELVSTGILNNVEADAVDISRIFKYLQSPLAARIRGADALWREQNFTINLSAGEINPEWHWVDEQVMVHGVIDCIFMEGENLILVDFKTGRQLTNVEIDKLYGTQMRIYEKAAELIFGRSVSESIVYFI
ncbi:MAG: helicase-exonuclease AddAB subunit AddA [Defluviitaleaceae bacterium]|nr:helicase-exonuclease AddAB subunit AddA [Defluviitaleaceae bacterium]